MPAPLTKRLLSILAVTIGAVDSESVAFSQQVSVFWNKPQRQAESVLFGTPTEIASGQLQRFDAQSIVLRAESTSEAIAIPSAQVVGIEVGWELASEKSAQEAYQQQNWSECLRRSQAVLNDPQTTPSHQKLVGLQLISAATQAHQLKVAVKFFDALQKYGMPEFSYAYLPIAWHTVPPQASEIAEAESLAGDELETSRLVAASWLLDSSRRAAAESQLAILAKSSDANIRQMAVVLQWRTIAPREFVDQQLAGALALRDAAPAWMQPGVTSVIADRVERAGEVDLAYELWLQVAAITHGTTVPIHNIATGRLASLADRSESDAVKKEVQELFNP